MYKYSLLLSVVNVQYCVGTTPTHIHTARTSTYLQHHPSVPSRPAVPVGQPHPTLADLITMNSCITM